MCERSRSTCFGILFVSLMLLIIGVYVYEKWFWEEWPPERIERVSGVRVPSYKIIERHEGSRSFIGDYENIYDIELSIPITINRTFTISNKWLRSLFS